MKDNNKLLFIEQFATVSDEINNRLKEYRKGLKDIEQIESKINELKLNLIEFSIDIELTYTIFNEIRELKSNLIRIRNYLNDYLDNIFHTNSYTMKILGGVGGKEADLFAKELIERYAKLINKEIKTNNSISINKDQYQMLLYETGVHRVQRIPITENSGRVHTSTVRVYLNPDITNFNLKLNKKDLRIETMRSSGAGGQHVNTTSSAVRGTHEPTGITCRVGTRRDQWDNKKEVLDTVLQRVKEYIDNNIELIMTEMRIKKGISSDRSEKIRTYNFLQDRVTDHRVKVTEYNLKTIWDDIDLWRDFILKVKKEIE